MSLEVKNSLRVRKTVLEMLKDRGYDISKYYKLNNEEVIGDNFSDNIVKYYKTMVNDKKTSIFVNNQNGQKCHVDFIVETKIKPTFIRESISTTKKKLDDNDSYILVTNIKPNNSILKIIGENKNINIQIIWAKRLIINITKHILQPKFRKMNDDEINDITERFSLKSKFLLPIMQNTDPICEYYDLESGDVIEIIRISQMGKNISYRCIK